MAGLPHSASVGLKPLDEVQCQAYLSDAFQVADLLEWILSQVGEADVWLSSFSISEEFIRRIFFIKKRHAVGEFSLVLDHKATVKTLKLWQFISRVVSRAYLADNHSKIILVSAKCGRRVSVVTSQNLTRGNRMESAVVTSSPEIFSALHAQINDLITNHSVPLHELLRQRTQAD